jgi:hypothetical protein
METQSSNPFAVAAAQSNAIVQVAQSKEAAEMQAALVVAKKFPRDEHEAFQRVITACKRRTLAEEATYLYARGGTQITGASIRLLEAVAVAWGNIQSGVVELSNENGESRVQCFGWDIQTNVYDSKTFTVRHERHTKEGVVKLTDVRDQYELVANFAARRKRACLEAVIPRDIIDAAVLQCEATLKSGHSEPITDRVRKMVTAFAEYGVSVEMIERKIQHKLDAIIEQELVVLRKIFTSLKDGMAKREDFFDVTAAPKPAKFETPKTDAAKAAAAADEKAEAAAGLAPATPAPAAPPASAPVTSPTAQTAAAPASSTPPAQATMSPAERMAKARAAKAAKDAEKAAAAAPAPAPPPPEIQQPKSDLFTLANQDDLAAQIADVLLANNITEPEVLNVLKQRQIADPKAEKLLGLPQEILQDLIENAPIIAAQVRIDRRAKER